MNTDVSPSSDDAQGGDNQYGVGLELLPEKRKAWITLIISAVAVLMTLAAWGGYEQVYAWFYATGPELWLGMKLWTLVTSNFLHIDVMHLLLNLYWMWILGQHLEGCIRPRTYLGLLGVSAVMSSVAELAWTGDMGVGLSGVVYAIFGFMLTVRGLYPELRRVLSQNVIAMFFAWLVIAFALTHQGFMQVANGGHVGGLIAGILLGWAHRSQRRRVAVIGVTGALSAMVLTVLCVATWQPGWQTTQAYRAMLNGDTALALSSFERARAKWPDNVWILLNEAGLRYQTEDYGLSNELLAKAVEVEVDSLTLNNFAWQLATCPDERFRDGSRAVKYAGQACELTEWKQLSYIDTLAAAHAEAGDFEEAIRMQEKTLEQSSEYTEIYTSHLKAYQEKRAWREPPKAMPDVLPN